VPGGAGEGPGNDPLFEIWHVLPGTV